jgi:predicted PurR-regulated permease PerM
MIDHKTGSRNYLIFASIFILLSFLIMKSFMFGIIWGGIIALSVWPVLETIAARKRKFIKAGTENNAAFFALIFTIIFLVPIGYAIWQISGLYQFASSYVEINTTGGFLHYPDWFVHLPMSDKVIAFWESNIATSQRLLSFAGKLNTEKILSLFSLVWGELFDRIITVIVMIVTLYFMLKNGRKVKENYQDVFAYWISDKSLVHIDSGIQSLRGTINGVILIGIVEGVLLSLPLIGSGIKAGFLIGLVAGILGVIPLLMPAMILPCLAYLFFTGDSAWALAGLIDLLIVWFVFENMLKPQVIGKKVKINSFIILVAMIGGMQLLGPVGLFLGPAVVSMAIGMVKDLLNVPKREMQKIDATEQNKETSSQKQIGH